MSTELVTTFMAALLLAGVAGLVASWLSPTVRAALAPGRLQIAAVVAVLATLSSLYLSEIADYVPCRYCWWQRIFMYPLAVVLPIAAWRNDRSIRRYALPLAGIGVAISARHVWLQAFPGDGGTCGISAPCSAKLVEAFGVFTIPQMAAMSFVLIIGLLVPNRSEASDAPPEPVVERPQSTRNEVVPDRPLESS